MKVFTNISACVAIEKFYRHFANDEKKVKIVNWVKLTSQRLRMKVWFYLNSLCLCMHCNALSQNGNHLANGICSIICQTQFYSIKNGLMTANDRKFFSQYLLKQWKIAFAWWQCLSMNICSHFFAKYFCNLTTYKPECWDHLQQQEIPKEIPGIAMTMLCIIINFNKMVQYYLKLLTPRIKFLLKVFS